MKNGKDVHRNLSLFLAFFLFTLTTSIAGQTALKIMPLGNSITFDTYAGDPRSDLEKYSYRYHLYTLLLADGYTFDFVGSEKSGGALLPETPPDYSENAGFPGYTASEILSLLQTGTNRDGDCEIVLCDNSYLQYFNPDIILLHLGTNGLNTEEDADDISEVMDDILNEIDTYESAAGKTVPVFLARIINRAGSNPNGNHDVTSYYNGLLDVVATGRVGDNIIMVDIETGADMDYRLTPSGDMIDELHPAPSGYIKMGTKWHEALESYNFAPPEVSDIPDQVADEGESISIPLDDFVFDPQEHDADLTWSNSGTSNFTVDIDPATRIASVSPVDPDWNGSETVTFEAADPFGVSAQDDVTFTMNPVNDAPVISNIGDQEINEGETFAPVALDDLVTDPDNGKDELNWSYAGNTELSVLIDPDRVATINIPTDWTGDETI
ncbi:MAG TPA: GDSL-type esterase/lipase family protein, partial [Bacteroidales bacterium]|nr:GDSL-type esterase/lipase family protein [Bacteroidales bacterium]